MARELREVDPNIGKAMKAFSDFMDDFTPVKKLLTDNRGEAMANKVIAAFKKTGEPAKRKALEKFANRIPKTLKTISEAKRLIRGEAIRRGAGRIAVPLGVAGLAGLAGFQAGRRRE